VKADIAYANFNVKLVGQSSGIAYGELGATHHSIEDFAWLRPLTNLTIIVPADAWETAEAVKWAAAHEGPVYLRLSRMLVPDRSTTSALRNSVPPTVWPPKASRPGS
jgi:transketolase